MTHIEFPVARPFPASDAPRRHLRLLRDDPPVPAPDVAQRIARAAELIHAEYARSLKLTELAAAAGMSEFHFARTFRAVIGLPPHRYLIEVRLDEALRRLELGDSVTNTSYGVGFSSPSHFATAFRRQFGVVPSAFTTRRSRVVPRVSARRRPAARVAEASA